MSLHARPCTAIRVRIARLVEGAQALLDDYRDEFIRGPGTAELRRAARNRLAAWREDADALVARIGHQARVPFHRRWVSLACVESEIACLADLCAIASTTADLDLEATAA